MILFSWCHLQEAVGLEGLPIPLPRKLADFAGILLLRGAKFEAEVGCKVSMGTIQISGKRSNYLVLDKSSLVSVNFVILFSGGLLILPDLLFWGSKSFPAKPTGFRFQKQSSEGLFQKSTAATFAALFVSFHVNLLLFKDILHAKEIKSVANAVGLDI